MKNVEITISFQLPDKTSGDDADELHNLMTILLCDAFAEFSTTRKVRPGDMITAASYVAGRYEWMSPAEREGKTRNVMRRTSIAEAMRNAISSGGLTELSLTDIFEDLRAKYEDSIVTLSTILDHNDLNEIHTFNIVYNAALEMKAQLEEAGQQDLSPLPTVECGNVPMDRMLKQDTLWAHHKEHLVSCKSCMAKWAEMVT